MYDGCVDVVLPPQLATEVMALTEPIGCSYREYEATLECDEFGGGLPRPSARIMFNLDSPLIVVFFLAFPTMIAACSQAFTAMIWRKILGPTRS